MMYSKFITTITSKKIQNIYRFSIGMSISKGLIKEGPFKGQSSYYIIN